MSTAQILGFVVLGLVVLAAFAAIATKKNLIKNEKLAGFLARHHTRFALGAILVALAHAFINFIASGANVVGALTFVVLLAQAIVGNLASRNKSNRLLGQLHAILPALFIVLVVIHIFTN